ncbi:MAG: alpha-glucan phosphorylase [Bryobacterales bacterium]|nr:alpha-glucan phosphorylase [Bryobacterales bacterium]
MAIRSFTNVDSEERADTLIDLALDLRWTWNHSTDDVWRELDPVLWAATQNPWLILQAVSQDRLRLCLADPRFEDRVRELLENTNRLEASDAWFQKSHPGAPVRSVAYFSMEYMLSEALPIYSGGLGNVAGDQLKAVSDLGVPVVGVGLLYQEGYFRQEIDSTGAQVAVYPFNDTGQLPILPLRDRNGDWLRLKIPLAGSQLWVRAWEARVGRTKLYLLDTNDPANLPAHRTITGELYGGGSETRLRQEIVLGIGGWRLLRALGIRPEVCHLNEGHSGFALIERARFFMEDNNRPFDVALSVTRAGNLFTTHTSVTAGCDRFSPTLIEKYFKGYAEESLNISLHDLSALGRADPNDDSEPFNMAYLAIHGSGAVNGVSRLHGRVSRHLFEPLFPHWPEAEVPIGHVTNGVHVPTWDSPEADALWEKACGKERWRGSLEYVDEQIRCVEDHELWHLRKKVRKALVGFVRQRLPVQWMNQGEPPVEIERAARIFDEHRLTLGFARRFAVYKRPNMLLHDQQRLTRILTDPHRPVQLILAGKAHPRDEPGQAMIKEWNEFIRRAEVREHVVFLADYDMSMTQELVAGVDLWLNTPRRPWEACGTSGMKVLANGGLNLSELDGWWAEAYAPEVGWAIGDRQDHGNDPNWDAAEADALYSLLEQEIVPMYYNRDERGIPREWVKRIRESMARLTPVFSTNRAVRQYTEEYYVPLAAAYCTRAEHRGRVGTELLAWEREMISKWHIHFGSVAIETRGAEYFYSVPLDLGSIKPDDVEVEIYAGPQGSELPFIMAMALDRAVSDSPGVYLYAAAVPADRPASDYTPRVIPRRKGVLIPLELPLIAWQK